jgi:hypothetical protein
MVSFTESVSGLLGRSRDLFDFWLRFWLAVFFSWSSLNIGHSFSFDFFVWEDVALSVLVRGMHKFVVSEIDGLSVFVQLVLISITAVVSSCTCISVLIRDVSGFQIYFSRVVLLLIDRSSNPVGVLLVLDICGVM